MAEKGATGKSTLTELWKKRIDAAKKANSEWEKKYRVKECYDYWNGDQLVAPFDEFGRRRAQINKIHPEVRNNIPSLYYYRPFVRLTATPEYSDDSGSTIEDDTKLLQDTVNHIVRDKRTGFRDATFLALKEAHWALGVCEVGYSANFIDVPYGEKPALKEKKDTKVSEPKAEPAEGGALTAMLGGMGMMGEGGAGMGAESPEPMMEPETDALGLGIDEGSDLASIESEVAALQSQIKDERFFVKHIPYSHVLLSASDMPCLEANDWVGYWEDVPVEDVKRATGFKNNKDVKPCVGDEERTEQDKEYEELIGGSDKVRLYRIWDLRRYERFVFAEGHKKELLRKPYKRLPLKFLRFDIDPYHFYPRPLLLSKLGPQDEYNDSREYLRKVRKGTVPRYTYDEEAVDAMQLRKLESGEMGTYIPRKAGTSNVIEPVNQPSFSENAIQTLTLSDKEFMDVGGVGSDARVATTKTATQAKIAATKEEVQDSFDRQVVADWLAEIARELLSLAIENMSVERFVAMNAAPDTQFANPDLGMQIAQTFHKVNAETLQLASQGVEWDTIIDLESLSPVSEDEKFQKLMAGLNLMANPPMARLFSVSPPLLKHTLNSLGIKSAKEQDLILGSVQAVVQMEQQLAAQSQNAAPGISPQAGQGGEGAPAPQGGGGPQPGGPQPPPQAG